VPTDDDDAGTRTRTTMTERERERERDKRSYFYLGGIISGWFSFPVVYCLHIHWRPWHLFGEGRSPRYLFPWSI
jgi:hypothetical protein